MVKKGPKAIHGIDEGITEAIDLVSSEGEQDTALYHRQQKRCKPDSSTSAVCLDIYSKSCKCKKDSPLCLAGIIPAPGGFRKKGLWQKDSKALLAQGADPADQLREVRIEPQLMA